MTPTEAIAPMNRSEWLREIDALVAKHVMEWEEAVTADLWPHWFSDEDGCPHPRLPLYSAQIASAWEVVERVRGDGNRHWILNGFAETETDGPGFAAEITDLVEDEGYPEGYFWKHAGEAWAVTAPLAICLAALRAHGVEIPEEPSEAIAREGE